MDGHGTKSTAQSAGNDDINDQMKAATSEEPAPILLVTTATTSATTTIATTAAVAVAAPSKVVTYYVTQPIIQKVKPKEQDETEIYSPILKDKSRMAVGRWDPEVELVQVIQMRGNFWKVHGFTWNKKDYLYPEEALLLIERSLLMVEFNNVPFTLKQFYEIVLTLIPVECYMTYAKLKSLEYIVVRHQQASSSLYGAGGGSRSEVRSNLHVITDDDDLSRMHKDHPVGFFHEVISFDIYLHTSGWSKKLLLETRPVHHVIVHNGEFMPNSKWLFQLLKASKETPLLFSIITSTLSIILEEVADAELYLKFKNEVAIPLNLESNTLSVFNIDEFMFKHHDLKAIHNSNSNSNSSSNGNRDRDKRDKKDKKSKKRKHDNTKDRNEGSKAADSSKAASETNGNKVAKVAVESE